ncbi:MAG TPA: hydroxymethylglutaryl-CoA reductase [Candidatus Saccharimonadales bacterium]|nr:hydroxymethylglutaryl-CoA reductase [Candidatus Saccharimonadales bacterium]
MKSAVKSERIRIPRNAENDYTHESAATRREFIEEHTGAKLSHVSKYSFDPATLPGNIENFTGVAQVPVGIAGPLLINGEHAQGEFYIPLATTEGTLISSYNRGMRLLTECGGVKTTVVDDAMQRAPVFMFADALRAREFGHWIVENFTAIRHAAESTTHIGKLRNIDQFAVGPLRYLRFNYTCGDAAGQNMASKATYAACEWIRSNHSLHPKYFLTGNIDTDKKHSHMNMIFGRGKRVVAEAVLRGEFLQRTMHVSAADLAGARDIQMAGAVLAGSSNNGAHSANAIAALFIATGQDAANVAEAHAAMTFTRVLENGDFYWSITLPALIVATYGGGTGLATQRECLEMLGCYGKGKVNKFAEICAAVVLAGETSLASAMINGDWVSAHEKLGRNRP